MSDRCKEQVRWPGAWPRFHQCSNAAVKDGFCKLHHPDAKKARQDKADAKWDEKHKAEMRGYECKAACSGMADPVAEVAKLKVQADALRELLAAVEDMDTSHGTSDFLPGNKSRRFHAAVEAARKATL